MYLQTISNAEGFVEGLKCICPWRGISRQWDFYNMTDTKLTAVCMNAPPLVSSSIDYSSSHITQFSASKISIKFGVGIFSVPDPNLILFLKEMVPVSGCYSHAATDLWLNFQITHSVHYDILTFRYRASCILGQAFHYSPENAFYIFNQQIYFIIWYLLDGASLI